MAINDYSRQYWDEFTVFVENFDSLARIEANNGTIIGNFSICEGRFGTGGCFDGGSAYVDLGDDTFNSLNTGTIEAWVKPTGTGYYGTNAYEIFIGTNKTVDTEMCNLKLRWKRVAASCYDDGTSSWMWSKNATTTEINPNTWYHIALTQDGTSPKIYVNGLEQSLQDTVSVNDNTFFLDDLAGTISYYIGKYDRFSGAQSLFNGTIDEVRISNIARVPVSQLWTLNYTLSSSEAMTSGNRYYWKIRALDQGGEQG